MTKEDPQVVVIRVGAQVAKEKPQVEITKEELLVEVKEDPQVVIIRKVNHHQPYPR